MKNIRIFETFKSNSLKVNESQDGLIHMVGVFGETGTRNRNGRVYNKENYGAMIEALQPQIAVGLLGECEHPYSLSIDLNNVSHRINSLQMNEDGTCTGEISILNTPKGQILKALVEAGLPLFVSSRGAGTVDEDGNVTLTKLVTFDCVATPSVENARLDLKESLCESIDDDLYIIKEQEDKDEEKPEDKEDNKDEEEPKKDEEEDEEEEKVEVTRRSIEEFERSLEDEEEDKKDPEDEKEPENNEEPKDDEDEDEKKVKESYIDYLDSLIEEIKTW